MRNHRSLSALSCVFAVLAVSGCTTQEIGPDADEVVIPGMQARPNSAFLFVEFAPMAPTAAEEDVAQQHANPETRPAYGVLFDGKLIAGDYGGPLHAYTVLEGTGALFYYLDAGLHHFQVQASGRAPVFEGDGELLDGGATQMLLYGPRGAVQALFISVPGSLPAGAARITVANVAHGDRKIELVRCTDLTTCTAISGTLAFGDVIETDVPDAFGACSFPGQSTTFPCSAARDENGVGIGYRLVPSAAAPNPPVHPISRTSLYSADPAASIFFAAPVYMSDDGQLERDIRF